MDFSIGIDLGGTSVKLGLIDQAGGIAAEHSIPTEADSGDPEKVVANIARGVQELLAKKPGVKAVAAGIGVPGHADPEKGIITFLPNIPCFKVYPLGDKLSKAIGMPVFVDNDANNAARGEFLFGSARGQRNFVFITLGTGVGGGVFIGGDMYAGEINYAGEVGHMTIQPDGKQCGCGNFGCWESYSSATAMIKNAKLQVERGLPTSLKSYYPDNINPKVIEDEAKKGDTVANMVFDEACRYTGIALGNLINIFNPSACIIGGGISYAGNFLLDRVKPWAEKYSLPKAWETVEIKIAELRNQAGIQGSAALAFMRAVR